jgi:hypothetical protein
MRLPLLSGKVLSTCRTQTLHISEDIKAATDLFVVGKGLSYPIA